MPVFESLIHDNHRLDIHSFYGNTFKDTLCLVTAHNNPGSRDVFYHVYLSKLQVQYLIDELTYWKQTGYFLDNPKPVVGRTAYIASVSE